jgi:pentatricopeptide repeat protein
MDTISSLTGNLEGSASNAEMVVEDMDVAPFDYSQLDLEVEEESPTSNLMSGGLQGPRTGQLEAMVERLAEAKTAPRSLGEVWSEADGDTSLFMTLPTAAQAKPAEIEMPTETLAQEGRSQAEQASATTPVSEDDVSRRGDGVPEVAMEGPAVTAHTPPAAQPSNFAQAPDMVDESAPPPATSAPAPATDSQPTPVEHQEPAVFRARVARAPWGNRLPSTPAEPEQASAPEPAQESKPEPVSEPMPTQENKPEPTGKDAQAGYGVGVRKAARTKVLEPVDPDASRRPAKGLVAPATTDTNARNTGPQVQFEESSVPKMPVQGDITTSGPLPSLDGFEDLSAWIERYPHDMGAHMALASAYTQAGDVDTALRVYRRMLRKPNVSENVLGMIQEELTELQDQAQQNPRYFQVRGDLLVRQGHRREAIDEYNKLG